MKKTIVFNQYLLRLLKAVARLASDAKDPRSEAAQALLEEMKSALDSGKGYDYEQFRSWNRRYSDLGLA